MEHATTTPPNVRRAIAIYSSRRRWFGAGSALLIGVALAAGLALIFMVADRYSLLPQFVRDAGPKLAEIALLGAVIAAIVALLRRHNAFSVAGRLDQAFRKDLDPCRRPRIWPSKSPPGKTPAI